MPSTDIKDYWRRAWGIGDRVGFKMGTPIIPATEEQAAVAKKVYKKSWNNLNRDQRAKIRRGQITLESVTHGGNIALKQEAQTRLKKFIAEFETKHKRLPAMTDFRKYGDFDWKTVKTAVDEGVIKIAPSHSTSRLHQPRSIKLKKDLLKLSKNSEIIAAFKKGEPPKLSLVEKILGIDKTAAARRVIQLGSAIVNNEIPLKGMDTNFKKKVSNVLLNNKYDVEVRKFLEKSVVASVGETEELATTKKKIRKIIPNYLKKLFDIDEPAGISSSVRQGSTPYGVFSQWIDVNINTRDKRVFDAFKATKEKALNKAIASGDKTKINKVIAEFNKGVEFYEKKFNEKVRPGEKRIRLFRVSLDGPENTIKNFKNLPEKTQAAFRKNFAKQKYSFIVPKDIKTIYQIAKDVKDPVKVAEIIKSARSGAKRIFSKFALGEGAILDEVLKKQAEGKSALESFGSALFLDKPIRKGLKRWKADDQQNLAYDRANLLRLVEEDKAGISSIVSLSMKDPDFKGQPGEYIEWLKMIVNDPHQQRLIRERDIETEEALTLSPERVEKRKKRYENWKSIPAVQAVEEIFKSDEQKAQDLENLLKV